MDTNKPSSDHKITQISTNISLRKKALLTKEMFIRYIFIDILN